jgi:hypothetical protein
MLFILFSAFLNNNHHHHSGEGKGGDMYVFKIAPLFSEVQGDHNSHWFAQPF